MPQQTPSDRGPGLGQLGSVARQLAASYLGPVLAITLLAGLLIGWLLLGWVIAPVVWVDAKPSRLSPQYQEVLIGYAADSYASGHAQLEDVARRLGEGWTKQQVIQRIDQMIVAGRPGADRLNVLKGGLLNYPYEVGPLAVPSPQPETPAADLTLPIVLVLAAAVILGMVIFSRMRSLQRPAAEAGVDVSGLTSASPSADDTQPMSVGRVPGGARPVDSSIWDGESQKPLAQYTTSYVAGDDRYDMSFSIESTSGDFLGECGIGISEVVVAGPPAKVTALEVWLFDKSEIRTLTRVLMSDFCFGDSTLRAQLDRKGEAVQIKKGSTLELKMKSLRVTARIVDLIYGEANPPENTAANSYFKKVEIEVAAWTA